MVPLVALATLAASAASDASETARLREAKATRDRPLRTIMQAQIPFLSRPERPGERNLSALAFRMASLWEEPELLWAWRATHELADLGWDLPEETLDPQETLSIYLDRIDKASLESSLSDPYFPLADLLGLVSGEVLANGVVVPQSPRDRSEFADALVSRASEAVASPDDTYRSALPVWVRAALIEERLRELAGFSVDLSQRVRFVSPEESAAFIAAHHSALPERNPRGALYDLGLEVGGRLVAVATATTPTGALPIERSAHVIEVSRVASDSTVYGAASALVAKMIDLVDDSRRYQTSRPGLLITYSLLSELGTTYKSLEDKGLRPVAFVVAKKSQAETSSRTQIASKANVPKIRWEAGAEAASADKTLLRLVRPYRKVAIEGRRLEKDDLKPLNVERLGDLTQALTGTRPRTKDRDGLVRALLALGA